MEFLVKNREYNWVNFTLYVYSRRKMYTYVTKYFDLINTADSNRSR